MAVFNEPAQWNHTLGNNADASTLPDDSAATAGTASLQKLFQLINATPIEAGGIAPDREDVNALFKYLGDQIFYTQNGGIPSYNAAYDYIPGRVVLYTDNKLYKCIQANGASSTVVAPDSVSPLGSDYWVQVATLADFTNLADKDFSNVNAPVQAFKDMSIGWGMPDYSAGITVSAFPYTAPSDGYFTFRCADVGTTLVSVYVNGVAIFYFIDAAEGSNGQSGNIQVQKNDVITSSASIGAFANVVFYPCKGAN